MAISADRVEFPDLEAAGAEDILGWAIDSFFPDIAIACSMQDAVVVDLAHRIEPRIEVFFLETRFHFPETLETARRIKERYDLNLVELSPIENAATYAREGYDACCADRKVIPLENYLRTKRAWVSGIRRSDGPSRADARVIEWDPQRKLVKVNPIAGWSDVQLASYIARHDVIVNPLRNQHYDSIGCHPCTVPGRGRQGRWSGTTKTECGLHSSEPPLHRPPLGVDQ